MNAENRRAPRRVLVVEDNRDIRESLRLLLELWGYRVEEAKDGLEGLHKAVAWQPDAAVVDIGLPGLDGYAVARRVRAALGRGIFLVALTAYRDRDEALAAGFDEHMLKPADPRRLACLLDRGKPAPARAAPAPLAQRL